MDGRLDAVAAGRLDYRDSASVLVFADDAARRAEANAIAQGVGARVGGAVSIAEGCDRLEAQLAIDAVMIELGGDGGDAQDRLLDAVNRRARDDGLAAVVSLPAAMIDMVAARIDSGNVSLLCDPTAAERAAELSLACGARNLRLNDITADGDSSRLQRLSEEVGRIARTLAELSQREEARTDPLGVRDAGHGFRAEPAEAPDAPDAGMIRSIIRLRRMRDQFFAGQFFADPAWDMLLDLMAARVERQRVAVSSLCIAAAVPATTALRWIRTLTDEGLFVRRADPDDGRRVFIELSDRAAMGMTGYFAAARRLGQLAL